MQRIIAIANQKGGVGKTVTSVNLATGLAQKGVPVTLIDADPQGNASICMGIEPIDIAVELADLMLTSPAELEQQAITNATRVRYGVNVIPSTIKLSGVEQRVVYGKDFRLRNVIKHINDDIVIIDCPPTLSFLLTNALTAATDVIIPLEPEPLAIIGVKQLYETIKELKVELNQNLNLIGLLATKVKSQTRLHNDMMGSLIDSYGERIFRTYIRHTISISESTAKRMPVILYAPGTDGAKDYNDFIDEIWGILK